MVPDPDYLETRMAMVARYNLTNFNLQLHHPATSLQEQEETSGLVWIVLFSILMLGSLVTNTIYTLAVIISPRKRTVPHILACLLFLVNLLEYGLLIFEFSLGLNQQYPFSEPSCILYQTLIQSCPLMTACLLSLMVFSATSSTTTTNRFTWKTGLALALTLCLVVALCIPSLMYSGMAIYPSGARYCVVDLGGVAHLAGLTTHRHQAFTALYYLIYRSVLPYLLPVFLLSIPCSKLFKRVNGPEDKLCTAAVTVCCVVSYFVFYSCLSAQVFVRQTLDISGADLSAKTSWIMSVLQSLFLLLATFQHVFRPLLCFSTDIDLRLGLTAWFRRLSKGQYTAVQSISTGV